MLFHMWVFFFFFACIVSSQEISCHDYCFFVCNKIFFYSFWVLLICIYLSLILSNLIMMHLCIFSLAYCTWGFFFGGSGDCVCVFVCVPHAQYGAQSQEESGTLPTEPARHACAWDFFSLLISRGLQFSSNKKKIIAIIFSFFCYLHHPPNPGTPIIHILGCLILSCISWMQCLFKNSLFHFG